ncbi:MAG TPA: NmrA/HSCARG family protein [Chitinophagaceae bacterium]|nr:NmrA/HSCARG family protein [Chitinophagaceae bacterium]
MTQKKTILVTGATGAQGGSVAKALLADDTYAVRILTRHPSGAAARELQAAGASIAAGDMSDPESLRKAMQGCYGVYGVTNFWEHFEHEYQLGKNLVDAVKESNIEHFVFHTLPDLKKMSKGKYSVPHCDLKAALEQYTRMLQIPATFLRIAFYYENFLTFFPLQKMNDGSYSFGFPQGDTKLAMISVEDVGGIVNSIFHHRDAYLRRVVGAVGADEPCAAYAAVMSKVLNTEVRYNHIPRDVYASFPFPGAEELANMFEVQRLHIDNRLIDLIETYALNPNTQSFEQWMVKNRHRFTAIMEDSSSAVVA